MLQTIEIRWFGPGAVPDDILAWFESLPGLPKDQPLRRDFYLQPVAGSGLSVKLREGGLEIKQRQKSYGHVRFGRSAAALVERWAKWRFPLEHSSDPLQSILPEHGSWTAVTKKRRLKLYRINEAGAVQAQLATDAVADSCPMGCHLELAIVWIDAGNWWTVAYEANFSGKRSLETLLAVVGHHIADDAPDHVSEANSYGYPHWLAANRAANWLQSSKDR